MKIEELARLHKALGEPVRLKIVEFLMGKECCCICHIAKAVKREQSVVFRHIQILKEAGIIAARKDDKFLMCCIADKERTKRLLEA